MKSTPLQDYIYKLIAGASYIVEGFITGASPRFLRSLAIFDSAMHRNGIALWNGEISEGDFIRYSRRLIDQEVSNAWIEGMGHNGLTADDLDSDMIDQIGYLVRSEYDYLDRVAAWITDQAARGATEQVIDRRMDLWVNRYRDVVNLADVQTAPPNQKREWVLGDTVHCDTCEKLNGTVMTVKEWRSTKYHPQAPPNQALECGGWRCKCKWKKTKKKKTGLPAGL